jgi:tetratricopeptide (TPR) repeat protein
MYYGRYEEAVNQLKRHLEMASATWPAERCASMRFIARSLVSLGRVDEAEGWALKACVESPGDREPWFELGKIMHIKQDWPGLYFAMKRLLAITERPKSYICEPEAWGAAPYDMASLAAWYIGLKDEGLEYGRKAVELDATDQRLKDNVRLMESLL